MNLTCIVTGPPSRRTATTWIHNDQIVLPQPGVSLLTDNSPHTSINTLIIHRVVEKHAGSYRCAPGNLGSDVVIVDILQGDFGKEILAQIINLFTEVIPDTIFLTQNVMISVIVLLSVSSCVIVLGAVRIVARKSETSQYCSRSNTQVLILSKV